MGVDAITRLPRLWPREYATPSSAPLLLQCWLRVAYASDPDFRKEVPASPASRLGTACHHVLELAGAGALPAPGGPEWRGAFESAWEEAITAEQEAASSHPLERHLPPAVRWPGYAMRKVRTRRLAEQLGSMVTDRGDARRAKVAELEQERQGFGGKLRGRPDVIRRTEQGSVIEDYKTGSLLEVNTSELKGAYRLQLLLYAALEQERTGEIPHEARLIPLEGDPATIEVHGDEPIQAARQVIAALDGYNSEVRGGVSPEALANASPEHCRFCPFAVRCPGFWSAVNPDWAAEGVLAVAGEVTASEPSRFDTFDLDGKIEAGSLPSGNVRLHGLDLDRFRPVLQSPAGSSFAATGLRGAGGVVGCTARTRLVVVDAASEAAPVPPAR